MKKYLFSLILVLVSYVGFSQKGLSYQAVILDPTKIEIPGQDISGQPLVNGDVWMKFSIYNGNTLQFEEVQKTRTDGLTRWMYPRRIRQHQEYVQSVAVVELVLALDRIPLKVQRPTRQLRVSLVIAFINTSVSKTRNSLEFIPSCFCGRIKF